jgi:deoxyribonuclease-4
MPILGAHMSIAGGYHKAVEAAAALGCDCVQLFTKNNNQWRAKPITDHEAELFQNSLLAAGITHTLSHASYLINLASPDKALRQKSIEAMIVELDRADQLGIPYVVFHPGSYTTSDESAGIAAIADAVNQILEATADLESGLLLENTAGQGSCLGWDFKQLGQIIDDTEAAHRIGVCIDTCHAFAAGYEMDSNSAYESMIKRLGKVVGLRKIRAFHLNDSKKPLGSRVDRHEHIGEGQMGLAPFRLLLNDKRFAKIPMYLETEKGEREGVDLDAINLKTLRSLVA